MTTYYYNPNTKTFYLEEIHGTIPPNSIAWTQEEYSALHNPPEGQHIDYSGDIPVLKNTPPNPPAPPSLQDQIDEIKKQLDFLIKQANQRG